MGRVYNRRGFAVRCDTHNSDISITGQMIKINIVIYLYTNKDIIWDEYTYMFIQYYSNISISIKKSTYNILFFTHNFGNHIALSFDG